MTSPRQTSLTLFYFVLTVLTLSTQGDRIYFPDEISKLLEGIDVTEPVAAQPFPEHGDACVTGKEQQGKCLPLNQCPELLDFVKSRNGLGTPGTINYLRKNVCKLLRRDVHLCCPIGKTPEDSQDDPENHLAPLVEPPSALPSFEECGLSTRIKIRGGKEFSHGTHPWLVGIGYPQPRSHFKVECGGTLITRRHVLTAAHCFTKPQGRRRTPDITHAVLGEHQLSTTDERVPPIVVRIADVKDPGYNATTRYHDIAVVILEKEIEFSVYIRPACLPSPTHSKHFDLENKPLKVIGWGRTFFHGLKGTDKPLEASLSLVKKPACKEAYSFAPEVPLDRTQFCLAAPNKDACRGDSGGPALYEDTSKFYRNFAVGVVAFGVECGHPKYPGVYTYVPEYFNWISSIVKNH